jgi:hypothetical protein
MSEVQDIREKLKNILAKLEGEFAHYQILPLVRDLEKDIEKLLGDKYDSTPVITPPSVPVAHIEPIIEETNGDTEAAGEKPEDNVTSITTPKKNRSASVKSE